MDFVYLCRNGKNEELRYSIRSVSHFFPEANIWVVGGKPDWYVGNYIPIPQTAPNKFLIQINNLSAILGNDSIGEDIVVMNDDFFIVRPIKKFYALASGTLLNRIKEYQANKMSSNLYTKSLIALYRSLKKVRRDPIDFELHTPMPIKKSNLKKLLDEGITTMWRSNYGNRFVKDRFIKYTSDVKFYNKEKMKFKEYDPRTGNSPFFSTDDDSFELIKNELLANLFPEPSKYEAPLAGIG